VCENGLKRASHCIGVAAQALLIFYVRKTEKTEELFFASLAEYVRVKTSMFYSTTCVCVCVFVWVYVSEREREELGRGIRRVCKSQSKALAQFSFSLKFFFQTRTLEGGPIEREVCSRLWRDFCASAVSLCVLIERERERKRVEEWDLQAAFSHPFQILLHSL